ncbi:MAG: hypothetical protein CMP59_05835 [Flavobacteriales bacterium]|nr:hypothetical protein [Flavobacteriales bacterium]|tara:strand:+ start:819 stop:1316 length:498 start_codon:yes stop_codon:yes gene_type:complete
MNYKELPDHSRVWIYQSSRELSDKELTHIQQLGQHFIDNWATHGKALKASLDVFHKRFIVLFADEMAVKASGCSIDSSVHFFKELEGVFDIQLFDRMQIAFKDPSTGEITTKAMHQLVEEVEKGELPNDLKIFNNLVDTKEEFENKWEVPLMESWLAQSLQNTKS